MWRWILNMFLSITVLSDETASFFFRRLSTWCFGETILFASTERLSFSRKFQISYCVSWTLVQMHIHLSVAYTTFEWSTVVRKFLISKWSFQAYTAGQLALCSRVTGHNRKLVFYLLLLNGDPPWWYRWTLVAKGCLVSLRLVTQLSWTHSRLFYF